MSSIDNPVVSMTFDNTKFEKAVKQTMDTLDALTKRIDVSAKNNSLDELSKSTKNFSFEGMASGLENISSKFSLMGAIGFSVIQSLTQSVLGFAKKTAGALIAPLVGGGKKRALAIEQAKFQFEGLGLDVADTMASALAAVKGTAFGLDEAATAAASLGASQVKVGEEMTSVLRGIAGVAALTGSSFSDIADVFQKVAGQGRLMGDDLNRLASRGVNAAAILAKSMGTTEAAVREMVSDGEISFKIFSEAMNESFGEHATKANETYTGSLANMKAALSRIGASVATPSYEAFRKVFNAMIPVIDAVADALAPTIDAFKVLSVIVSNHLVKALESIKIGVSVGYDLKRTFLGVVALFDIGWQVIKGFAGVFKSLFDIIFKGSGGFLSFTGDFGDFLVDLNEAIKNGDGLTSFFSTLTKVLTSPTELLKALAITLGRVLGGFSDVNAEIGDTTTKFSALSTVTDIITGAFNRLGDGVRKVWDFLAPIGEKIGSVFSSIGSGISSAFENVDYASVLDTVNTALLGGLLILVKNFLAKGLGGAIGGSLYSSLRGVFFGLSQNLKVLQATVKVSLLMQIAVALAILTVSVIALAAVDSKKLTTALGAMTVMFAQFGIAMKGLLSISQGQDIPKLIGLATAMVLVAYAIGILSVAVKILATMSWAEMTRGLTGIVGLMASLAAMSKLMTGATPSLIAMGLAMIPLGAGLTLMAGAIKIFGNMDWDELSLGLAGLAGALLVIAAAMRLMPLTLPITAAGLVLVGVGITAIAGAIKIFASMDGKSIGKGLYTMAAALVTIAAAMNFMPLTLPITAAGLVLVGIALGTISVAILAFSSMSWEEIGRGLATLAGSLTILAGGLYLMTGTLAGAAALVVATVALTALVPVLIALGSMSWASIGKGLATIAAVFLVLGAAALILTPVVPVILALSLAILAIGVAMGLAGIGIAAFIAAFTAFIAVSAAGMTLVGAIIEKVISAIVPLFTSIAEGIVAFAKVLIGQAPVFLEAFTSLFSTMLQAAIDVAPKVAETVLTLIDTLLDALIIAAPKLISAGGKILLDVIKGIGNNTQELVIEALHVIAEFIRGLGKGSKDLTDAGFEALIDFIDGISEAVDEHADELADAGGRLGVSLTKGFVKGMASISPAGVAFKLAKKAVGGMHDGVNNPPFPSREGLKIGKSLGIGFIMGIAEIGPQASKTGSSIARNAVSALREGLSDISGIGNMNLDSSPVITPILDLSNVKNKSSEINSLFGDHPLSAKTSYASASSIAQDTQTNRESEDTQTKDSEERTLVFNQTNNSPKAISPVETYRNTKSQISLAKEALSTS